MKLIHNRNRMAFLMLGLVLLTGCDGTAAKVPDEVARNSLVINKDGSLTAHIVDIFDKDYYSLDDLKAMAEHEIEAYVAAQGADGDSIVLKKVAGQDSNMVIVTYDFDDADTYSGYTGQKLFFGTVEEAQNKGYDLEGMNQVLSGISGAESVVTGNLAAEMPGKHVVLLEEGVSVYCPYKVSYISENAVVREDGSIDTAGVYAEDYPAVIVLEK